jgi:hypothetical protein
VRWAVEDSLNCGGVELRYPGWLTGVEGWRHQDGDAQQQWNVGQVTVASLPVVLHFVAAGVIEIGVMRAPICASVVGVKQERFDATVMRGMMGVLMAYRRDSLQRKQNNQEDENAAAKHCRAE